MEEVVSVSIGEANLRISTANVATQKLRVIYKAPSQHTNDRLMSQITSVISKLKGFDGIGIASPGILNVNSGVIRKCRNLELKELGIVHALEEKYKVPVFLSSRAIAGVLAEHIFGVGKRVKDMAYLTISSGIDIGFILNGRVLIGKEGNAHEMGHNVIEAGSEVRCGCGRRGHWEGFCSGNGIPVYAKYLLDTRYADKTSILRKIKDLQAKDVYAAAKKDTVAKGIIDSISAINVLEVANINNVFDLEMIAIGGGVALYNQAAVLNPIARGVKKYTVNTPPKIVMAALGELTVPYGAVADFM